MDSKLVENNQRPVAVGRKEYLFCGNDDAAEDAAEDTAVMYTTMGCCRLARVDVEKFSPTAQSTIPNEECTRYSI